MRFQPRQHRKASPGSLKCLLLLIAAAAMSVSGCGTIPDVRALLHDKLLYKNDPSLVGPKGALTAKQGERAIDRLKEHQETPSDILDRHLAFEQALSDIPLVVGNKVTLLENGPATYRAMLVAIRNAHDNINIQMYI